MTPEQIKQTYESGIVEILNEVRDNLQHYGYEVSEVDDMTDEDYAWSVAVRPKKGKGELIDVKITIAESEHWDGSEDGVNFMLDVVAEGGSIVGGLVPYNYTDKVWVPRKDEDAIDERWREFSHGADSSEIVYSIQDYYERQRSKPKTRHTKTREEVQRRPTMRARSLPRRPTSMREPQLTQRFRVGDRVQMSDDALANYGERWRGVALVITHVSTAYMPSSEFFSRGKPQGYHPGYDPESGSALYDFNVESTGRPGTVSLYDWELEPAEARRRSSPRRRAREIPYPAARPIRALPPRRR